MKKTIRLIVTSIGLLSIFACTKDLYELENENSFSKEKVEKWFETSFKESEQWKQNKAAQSSTPDWSQGTYVKKGKLEVYEFPLIEDKVTVTVPVIGKMTPENTSKVRNILFSTLFRIAFVKTETGQIVVRKLYYVPDYDYLLSKEYDINEAVINKEGDDFTGTLITKKWNDEVLSYHQIANGKAVGQIKRINGAPPETDPNLQLNMKTYKRNSRMSARDIEGGWLNEVVINNGYSNNNGGGYMGLPWWYTNPGSSGGSGGGGDGSGNSGYDYGVYDTSNQYYEYSSPISKDPCEKTKDLNTSISKGNNYTEYKTAVNNILGAAYDGNEHSITLGKDQYGKITPSAMNHGTPTRVAVNTTHPGAFATLHNHPNKTPLSTGDIYATVQLNEKNINFTTNFILTDGEVYGIIVTDPVKAQAFVKAYPSETIPGYSPEFPDEIFNKIDALKEYLGISNFPRTQAIALILDKYNSGISIVRADSNSYFGLIKTGESKGANGETSYYNINCN